MKLVLGSASPRRRQILKEMGYEFEVVASEIDETVIRDADPQALVLKLAHAKADAVIAKLKEPAIVVAADSMAVFQGQIYEKPKSKADARRMLSSYKNLPVDHYTSVVVANIKTGKRLSGVDKVTIYFKPFSENFFRQVVDSGKVLGSAGAIGMFYFPEFDPYLDRFEGEPESLMGMPPKLIRKLLSKVGI